MRLVSLTAGLVLGASSLTAQSRCSEVLCLSAEDDAPAVRPTMPKEVWAALAKDQNFQSMQSEGDAFTANLRPKPGIGQQAFRHWFSTYPVTLGFDPRADLIVRAEPPLAGANVSTFWVFVHRVDGYHLALSVPAHNFVIEQKRVNGWHTIHAYGMTCCRVDSAWFRYDGGSYVRFRKTSEEIR